MLPEQEINVFDCRSPKVFNKQNGYEGELSLVANEVKKKKTYAVQKKKRARLVVIGIRG